MRRDIAMIGAGIAGLTCARALVDAGRRVFVFDKARGPGGRMSTRRAEALRFDHGAQYFTVRDEAFRAAVDVWIRAGVVARWDARIAVLGGPSPSAETPRYVGVPGMSAICRHLAEGLAVRYGTRVAHIERVGSRLGLMDAEGADLGLFDAAVVSAPAPQAATLLELAAPTLAAQAARVEMSPCWAVMVSFAERLDVPFDGAFVHDSPLGWVARNASKPGRPPEESWVLHGSPAWSTEHFSDVADSVQSDLLGAFGDACGIPLPDPLHIASHRWAYALPENPLDHPALVDPESGLVACGDWCGGPRVEGAYLSGRSAAGRLLELQAGLRGD